MNDLSKQQLILLALLVSFVTSMATGIVTVALMDQAPQGVTRTINQIVERTIQQVVPQDAAVGTISISVDDQVAKAAAAVAPSVVKIRSASSEAVAGIGIVVSKSGVVMTDKSVIAQVPDYAVVLSDGRAVQMTVVQSQTNGDIVFLAPPSSLPPGIAFTPIQFASSYKLGQAVFSLAGTSTAVLGQGVIDELSKTATTTGVMSSIGTSIAVSKTFVGSPLFDVEGKVIGMRTGSLPAAGAASFYPVAPLAGVIPVVK